MMLALTLLPLLALSATALPHTTPLKRAAGVHITSARRPGKCIGTTYARNVRPGISVDLVDCTSDAALLWDIERGAGFVKMTDGTLVLDANTAGNFGTPSTEYPVNGKASQNWYWTDDNRIAITGGNQCLDDDGSRLQTYECTTGNTNQIFYAVYPNDPKPPVSNDPYPDIPQGAIYQDKAGDQRRLHPFNRPDLCATVMGTYYVAGNAIAIAHCLPLEDPSSKYQIFNAQGTFSRSAAQISIVDSPSFCVAASGSNGSPVTIQPCESTTSKWQWTQVEQYFFLGGARICLDVQRESQPGNESPIKSLRKLQTWECGVDNVQQKWTFLW